MFKKSITKNLILLFIGLLIIYLLQKNGDFFPMFFLISSIILIYKNKTKNIKIKKKDVVAGVIAAIFSLHPFYGISIAVGYIAAKQTFDNSNDQIRLFPVTKREIVFYGLLPAIFLTLLNIIWMLQSNPVNFSFRMAAITGSLIASIPEEILYRYLVFAICVTIKKNQLFSKGQHILCYLILIIPHVLMHFPVVSEINLIDLGLMSVFGITLTCIQRKSSLSLAIIVHFIIDFFRIIIFGV